MLVVIHSIRSRFFFSLNYSCENKATRNFSLENCQWMSNHLQRMLLQFCENVIRLSENEFNVIYLFDRWTRETYLYYYQIDKYQLILEEFFRPIKKYDSIKVYYWLYWLFNWNLFVDVWLFISMLKKETRDFLYFLTKFYIY